MWTVLLGGPVGTDVDSGDALLVVTAADEAAVHETLAPDPWHDTILTIKQVEHWSVWLRSPPLMRSIAGDQ